MNRRTADVFSPGYATLFKLDKEDLEEVVKEYPEAQIALQKKADEVMREKKEGTGGGGSNGKQGGTNSQDPKNRDQKEGKEQNDQTKVNDEQEDTGHKECNVTKSKKEQRKVNNQETFDNQWPNRTDSNLFNKNLDENENTGLEHKVGNKISTPKMKRRSFTLPEFERHKSPKNVNKGFNSNAELFKFTNSNVPIEVKRYKESNVDHGFNPLHELQSVKAKDAGPHSTVHNFGEKGSEVPHHDNDQSGPGTVKAELNNEVKEEELSDETMTNRAEVRIDVTAPLSGSVTPSTRRTLGKQAGVSPLRARYEKL